MLRSVTTQNTCLFKLQLNLPVIPDGCVHTFVSPSGAVLTNKYLRACITAYNRFGVLESSHGIGLRNAAELAQVNGRLPSCLEEP